MAVTVAVECSGARSTDGEAQQSSLASRGSDGAMFDDLVKIVFAESGCVVDFLDFERNADGSGFVDSLEVVAGGVENFLAEAFAGFRRAARGDTGRDGDKSVVAVAVGDYVVITAGGAGAHGSDLEDAGFQSGLMDGFDELEDVNLVFQIRGVLYDQMWHTGLFRNFWTISSFSAEIRIPSPSL
jgi:hypothetical protein